MKPIATASFVAAYLSFSPAFAQQTPAQPAAPAATEPFKAGQPLPVRPNVRTFGSFCSAESVSVDTERDLYVVVSPCTSNTLRPNDGYVSLVNPDGTVNTLKWIQGSDKMGVTLNDPRGSDINHGMLYLADIDTVRMFDIKTGEPRGEVKVEGAVFLNDLEVTDDGTVYVTDSGSNDKPDASAIYKITPDGAVTDFARGGPLQRPNGIAFDPDGNIVTVLLANTNILTYAPDGELVKTEDGLEALADGLVILADGTKITTSLRANHLARIPPGGKAELLVDNVFTPASIGYDAKRNRVIVPENQQNAITMVDLQ